MFIRIHKNIFHKAQKAQSLSEYALLLGLIVIVFTAMQFFTKRGIQSVIKFSADQIGLQSDAGDEQDPLKGHLVKTNTPTEKRKAIKNKDYTSRMREERMLLGGSKITYDYNELTKVEGGSGEYVLGYEEKNE